MKTIDRFLSELRSLDVKLWSEGDRLRYKAPPETLTPTLLQELRSRKIEILEYLHQANTAVSSNLPSILPAAKEGDLPLSFAQARLWFLNQLEPDSTAYNMPAAYRLTGVINITALEQSLNEIWQRHSILRTVFPSVDGQPRQVILKDINFTLSLIDLKEIPETQREASAQSFANQEAQQPFDLAQGPLFRAKLLRLTATEHVLLLTMHHIVYDGWSYSIFFREMAALYAAFCADKPDRLTKLPIQYVDFAVWQHQYLQGEVLESQLSYWKEQLGGSLPVLQLPTDYPPPPAQSYQGADRFLELSENLVAALKSLSQGSGVTLFMTLLAAFKVLLYRYSGQEDIIVGTPIAGRNQEETEQLIGLFLNCLATRTNLSGTPTFRQLLNRVREVTLGAYAHQDLPFEKLVEKLQPERSLSRHPLFDVMFNFFNTPQTTLELSGLNVRDFSKLSEPESKFTMTLYVQEQGSKLSLQLVYRKALFSPERITCFLDQFKYLLEQIIAAPDSSIQSYSLVTPKTRTLLPNPSIALPEPDYKPITTQIISWANITPEQVAVSQGSRTWSYQELVEAAQITAQILLIHQVERGQVVAVSGCRSFGLIASILGVLLSGAVLLTLDENLPQQRQQLMLTSAKAQYLLYVGVNPPKTEGIWESLQIISIHPDTGKPKLANSQLPTSEPLVSLSSEDSAYLFFTSGTTGVPKGVLGSHKGLSHFLSWQRQTFCVKPQDRVAQLTGLSFDVVLRDVFLPLTSGATLCLPAQEDDLTPSSILPWLERQQISLLHTVPALAQSWLINVPPGVSLRTLRWVFFAGEPLTDSLVRHWRSTFPESGEIANLYGPTETTLAKCYYHLPVDLLPGVQPIGFPLPETQALVLGENHQLCGIGEAGEIVLRTPFRTYGYINAPEEKLFQFVKNPFCNDKDDLLYYTGDRGRYGLDGSVEILGRQDRQIKIRGVRIEPGEIETLLNQHPNIQSSVIIAREDMPGDKRLVAYIVFNQQQAQSLTSSELRSFLKQRLPEYMLPSSFVFLDALPLTPNGKVDRHALPAPDQIQQMSATTFVAPRDELEIELTKIWEDVLGIKPISIKDNFFELGGHSLLAVRLFAQIEKTFGKNLPLATLFQESTIEKLASILRPEDENLTRQKSQSESYVPWSPLVPIQPKGSKPPLFCIHGLGGDVLFYWDLARHLGLEQPVYGLQCQGLDGRQLPHTRIEDMASHYLKEIQTLQPNGPYFLGGYSFGGTVAFEMAQQLHSQGEKVGLLILFDSSGPNSKKRLPFIKRIPLHWNKFLKLGPNYFWEKAGKWSNLIPDKFQKIVYKFYLDIGRPLTRDLRHLHIMEINAQAARTYTMQVYPGKLLLLRTDDGQRLEGIGFDFDPQLGWGKLVAEELEIQYVPGSHHSFLKEPYVQVLAEKLKDSLNQAQTHNWGLLNKKESIAFTAGSRGQGEKEFSGSCTDAPNHN
ncbi:MAG: amino acid adenylation domain-containing protein [Nostoc sp.]|uniref:amino acid adenylation domain-containing protein n=1 Tax=Nostoc sp. TaxID=1180 RepID=UPI002FFCEFC1